MQLMHYIGVDVAVHQFLCEGKALLQPWWTFRP